MNVKVAVKKQDLTIDMDAVCARIAATQRDNGDIPWSSGDKTDPWDLVEAAMGLTIGGQAQKAEAAFRWLKNKQRPDGSWYAAYRNDLPDDRTVDTNMSSYLAAGLFHHYLVTGNIDFIKSMWPVMCGGIDFALSLQTPRGEIYWAKNPEGRTDPMSLLTGSSSIYFSLKCALALAHEIGADMPGWRASLSRLGHAIQFQPHLFNVAKSRFSMDWFYPILSGAITGPDAQKRIDRHWKKFVVEGQGVKCVADEPWVTIAESCELVMALAAMGNENDAQAVFSWIQDKCFDDGSFWCGFTYPNMVVWPEEKISWTNAAVLLAADALYHLTPAGRLFNHNFWKTEYPFLFDATIKE
ncbi:MAG: phenyltransferase domain-containing protein [Thermodesulfobacteriota bacterium]